MPLPRPIAADLKTQEKYGVKYLRYWFDESAGKVFCLVKRPNKEAQSPCIGKPMVGCR